MLDGKVLSRTSEPSLHLVDDEEEAIAVANLAHALEVARKSGNVASLTENGLDDDAGRVARGSLLLEEELELRLRSVSWVRKVGVAARVGVRAHLVKSGGDD